MKELPAKEAQKDTGVLIPFGSIKPQVDKYIQDGGLGKGLSTGWHTLDKYYKLSKSQLNIVTGVPQSGKSEFLDQLMMQAIMNHNWHITFFSPENWPLPYHAQKFIEKWSGKSMFFGEDRITDYDVQDAIDQLGRCISFIDPPNDDMSIDPILDLLLESAEEFDTDAFVLDPWNEIEHSRPNGMTETEYIGRTLTRLRNFGRRHDIAMFLVAHPTKLVKKDDLTYPVPSPYDISGSANWYNKADNCLSIWRDYNDTSNTVEVHIKKIRNKALGQLGSCELYWCWENGLFFDDINMRTHTENHGIKRLI